MRLDQIAARSSAVVALAAVLLLSGCTAGVPVSATSPITSDTGASSAAPAPAPIPTDEPEPSRAPDAPEQTNVPPAEWTNEELIGACKVEWNNAGATDWSQFSPDAMVEPRGDSYYVAFKSNVTAEVRDCTISGTPSASSVTMGS
ncbi:hypothetical protein [Naasia aerilata]|nr:hypothetical protein [Naasia aerilata]